MTTLRTKTATAITEIASPFVLVGVLIAVVALRFETRPVLMAAWVILFIVAIPQVLAVWMARTRRTTDKFIVVREQRHRFYALSAASFLAGIGFTWLADTSWQLKFSTGYALAILVVVAVINLRMKISVHALAASFTTLCVPVVLGHPGWAIPLVAAAVCVPWARVYNERHSMLEAASGFGLGLVAGAIFCGLLMR